MSAQRYKENKKFYFRSLYFRCSLIRHFGKKDRNHFDEAIKNVKAIEEFKSNDLPELEKFALYYTRKVQNAIKNANSNPSRQQSIYIRQKNRLIDLINEYKTNRNGDVDGRLISNIRKRQRAAGHIDKITFHRNNTNDKVIISDPKLIIDIFFELIESEGFDEKLEEFKNTKRSNSYYVELYRLLEPFYLYLREHIPDKSNRDIYRLVGEFLQAIGLPFTPPVEKLEDRFKHLNR